MGREADGRGWRRAVRAHRRARGPRSGTGARPHRGQRQSRRSHPDRRADRRGCRSSWEPSGSGTPTTAWRPSPRISAWKSSISSRRVKPVTNSPVDLLEEAAFHAKYGDELAGVERVLREIDRMAETVPVQAPWLAPEADAWDRVTVGAWYDRQDSRPGRPHAARDLHRGDLVGAHRGGVRCSTCSSTCRCAG